MPADGGSTFGSDISWLTTYSLKLAIETANTKGQIVLLKGGNTDESSVKRLPMTTDVAYETTFE